eukprot:9978917-Lingulodinium_polyedra.AAC.1
MWRLPCGGAAALFEDRWAGRGRRRHRRRRTLRTGCTTARPYATTAGHSVTNGGIATPGKRPPRRAGGAPPMTSWGKCDAGNSSTAGRSKSFCSAAITPGFGAPNAAAIPTRTCRRSTHAAGGKPRNAAGVQNRCPGPLLRVVCSPCKTAWSENPVCHFKCTSHSCVVPAGTAK